jgi:hypothetical protein
MKIFFAVSPRAVSKYELEFSKIFNLIEKLGHSNLNNLPIDSEPDKFYQKSDIELNEIHIELTRKIKEADIIIIETTIHSLTMGFYTKMALDLDKPVILLHQPGSKPYYFSAIQNERMQIVEYRLSTLPDVLPEAIDYAKQFMDVRFNLMIPSELNEYLKWAAQRFHTVRSNFVRNLILEHKKQHLSEYKADMKR